MAPTAAEAPAVNLNHYGARYNLFHNGRLIFYCLLLSTCYFTFGYDGYVYAGVIAMPGFALQFGEMTPAGFILPAKTISIINALPTVGSLIGAIINSILGDRFGRKKTIYIGCLIGLVGMTIQTAAYNVAMITVGRVLGSASTFMLVNMALAFSAELAPASLRGSIITLSSVTLGVSGVLVSGINWRTSVILSDFAWRLPVGLQLIGPVLIIIAVYFTMESPTYYLIQGQDDKARESLTLVRQGYSETEMETELENMRHQNVLRASEQEIPWGDVYRGPNLRRTILASSFVVILQVAGLAFATQYAAIFFVEIGNANPFLMTFALTVVELGGAIVGQVLIEVLGRRKQALFATSVVFVLNVIIGGLGFAPATNKQASSTVAGFCLVFGFFLACTMSPLQYCSMGEFPTSRLRNKTGAYALLNSNLAGLVVSYVLPYITDADEGNLGAKTFLIFAGFMLLAFVWVYFYYPEIKGRTLAELDEMFENRVPAREFKGYVCSTAIENTQVKVDPSKEEANIVAERVTEKV